MMKSKIDEKMEQGTNIDNFTSDKCRILLGNLCDYNEDLHGRNLNQNRLRSKKENYYVDEIEISEIKDYKKCAKEYMDDWGTYVGDYN
jgi:hypothetical protein